MSETVGNAAAMREALETIHDKVNSLDEECGVDPVEVRDLARAAISAPARNVDKFTSLGDAINAWRETPPNESGCFDEWLFAPAAERKGEGDGK